MRSMWGRCGVDVGSISGRPGVHLGSRRWVEVGSIWWSIWDRFGVDLGVNAGFEQRSSWGRDKVDLRSMRPEVQPNPAGWTDLGRTWITLPGRLSPSTAALQAPEEHWAAAARRVRGRATAAAATSAAAPRPRRRGWLPGNAWPCELHLRIDRCKRMCLHA